MNHPGKRNPGRPAAWLVLLATLAWSLAVGAAPKVHEFQLDNGMQILVQPDHRAPVITSQVWYRVGSSYEHSGVTGISHVLEHMMFKGTDKHPPGEFSEIVAANGGKENAFTSRDYTAYFENMASDRLDLALSLEADRMQNLLLDAKEFAREVDVVQEERRMRTEDNPQALTFEQFNATAYLSSPYRWPIIGWMSDLERLEVGDLRDWYRRYYAPDNATLVVVGDVEPAEVLASARRHFGDIPASGVNHRAPRREVEQRGERRIRVKAPAKVPFLLMGYKAPSLMTAEEPWEAYALEVLAGILDGGQSARLTDRLVRGRELAASAGASYGLTDRLQTLVTLQGTPVQEVSVDELEAALRTEIQRLQKEPVSPEELDRVKAQVVASDVFERDSIFYQAMQLGVMETVGLGHEELDRYVERIRAVTPEQVREVARRYLTEDRLTVAVLDPQPIEPGDNRSAPSGMGGRHVR